MCKNDVKAKQIVTNECTHNQPASHYYCCIYTIGPTPQNNRKLNKIMNIRIFCRCLLFYSRKILESMLFLINFIVFGLLSICAWCFCMFFFFEFFYSNFKHHTSHTHTQCSMCSWLKKEKKIKFPAPKCFIYICTRDTIVVVPDGTANNEQ